MTSLYSYLRVAMLVALVTGSLTMPGAAAPLLQTPSAAKPPPKGKETLGSIGFVAPVGWTRKASADFVSFETTDAKLGRWALLGVYRDQPGRDNAGQDFAYQWQQVVMAQFHAPLPSEIDTSQHPAGYEIKVGGTQVQTDAGPAALILTVASGHGVAISALFLTNHNDYLPELDRFMQRVTLGKPKPGSVTAQPPATAPTPAAGGAHPPELVGTWVAGSVSGPALYDRSSGAFTTLASGSGGQLELKSNGQASWARMLRNHYGCTNGLNTFRDGTWSLSGNKLTFHWTQGENQTVTCGKVKAATTPFKANSEDWYIRPYVFEGEQKLGLALQPGGENTYSYTLANR